MLLATLASNINPGSKFSVLDPVRAPVGTDSLAPHSDAHAAGYTCRAGFSWKNLIRPHTPVWTLVIGGRVDCGHDSVCCGFGNLLLAELPWRRHLLSYK